MRLKRLSAFRAENFDGKPPRAETLKGWGAATKQGGIWYVDMDALENSELLQTLRDELESDPEIRALVQ